MMLVSKLDYRIWKRFSMVLYIGTVAVLILIFIIGTASHGATRWIAIGSFQFQPSEVAKLTVVIFTAHLATITARRIGHFSELVKAMIAPLIIVGLIASENLSTAIVCLAIAVVILFVASPKYWQFILIIAVGTIFMGIFLVVASYRLERIGVWLHPEEYDTGYQTLQALYAIGSGGLFGKGLGQSIQKLGFIPESHNDYIFSVLCEELGLFGAICIISMFMILIWRCMVISNNAPDLFGSLIVIGVMTHIAVQVLVNIAVVTNSIPPTGVPLPFISYGGTALCMVLVEMGVVLSVSRQIRIVKS